MQWNLMKLLPFFQSPLWAKYIFSSMSFLKTKCIHFLCLAVFLIHGLIIIPKAAATIWLSIRVIVSWVWVCLFFWQFFLIANLWKNSIWLSWGYHLTLGHQSIAWVYELKYSFPLMSFLTESMGKKAGLGCHSSNFTLISIFAEVSRRP